MTRKNIFASVLVPKSRPNDEGMHITASHASITEQGEGIGARRSPAVGKLAQALDVVVNRSVIDLDPKLVDPSPYPDRLADDSSGDFHAFKKTIAAEGQKIPVQVRPHPTVPGRYQLAYGHRRWRAATELNTALKAIVTALSDADLAVMQGLENSARQDLTWIERALFAARMDAQQVKARDIYAALGIDDAQLTHMRTVTKALPDEVIKIVGRAPKVGRRRWLDLAETYRETPNGSAAILKSLSADRIPKSELENKILPADRDSQSASDSRFQIALDALRLSGPQLPAPTSTPWTARDGKPVGVLKTTANTITLTLDLKRRPEMGPRALELLAALKDELVETLPQSNRKG